ncbi:MAG: hypothetical protein M1814_001116 [Vezdaea aestivalis]|nr:MAG: hypothetical protein M1814_001116 [Vezdaea aestivalis]
MLQAHTWTLFISSWPLFRPLTAYEKPITKPVINTIECDGGQSDLPRGVYGPTGGVYVEGKSLTNPLPIWSHVNFTNASDLCSASGNLAANIGGVCVEDPLTPSIRQIRFCVTLAWLASLFNNELARYCSKVCHCSTNEDDYLSNSLLRAQAACSLSAVIDQSWVDYFNAPPGQSGLLPPSHIRPEGPEPTGEEGIEDLVVPGERGLVGGLDEASQDVVSQGHESSKKKIGQAPGVNDNAKAAAS